jgi:hypothetical protein
MPSPFPGVDPYLESQHYWPDFHATFINYWREAVADVLPDNYEVRIDERFSLVERPLVIEDERRETYIRILHRPDRTLVAILEVLSPANKEQPGFGTYLEKRQAILHQKVHLVELDLLLSGRRMPLAQDYPLGDYFALVAPGNRRPDCDVYEWSVRQPLPAIPIPLLPPDPPIRIDLGAVFSLTFDRGRYARSIDYAAAPHPALAEEDRNWAVGIARAAITPPAGG